MAEIVSFNGNAVPGEPEKGVVEILETLLERAKRGEIAAVAYATCSPAYTLATGWEGASGTRQQISCAVSLLNHRYHQRMMEQDA
jgi:hypothetical protein